MGAASEKKPNAPVVIQREEYVDVLDAEHDFALDEDLFGSDDLIGVDVTPDNDDTND